MKGHSRLFLRNGLLLVAIVPMIVVHGVVLKGGLDYTAWPTALILGVIALAVLKHLGLLGALYAFLRQRSRRSIR